MARDESGCLLKSLGIENHVCLSEGLKGSQLKGSGLGQSLDMCMICLDSAAVLRCSLRQMARQVRIQYEGAVYHVMCRGDRREDIFRAAADRELFLCTLAGMCERSGILVHSYVLMSNPYHLLIATPPPNLVAGLKKQFPII
jgi:hypothetical protein